jgi:hypothetical protein
MDTLSIICISLLALQSIKSMVIGSKFNFISWFKYGQKYLDWYDKNITNVEYKP